MNQKAPDVRVRLSAEGVAEVVNAFKRVQAEAERTGKAGKKGGEGLGFLSKQIGSVRSLLPALAGGAAIAGLVAMGKHALNTADSLGKLNQKTGISVETLSTLSFAARTADVEQEALNGALVKFSRAMDEYDKGAKGAREGIKGLFGSSKALVGLNQDERFLKIVDALAKLEPGAKRTGAAMQFFGKSGAELLPLIDDLGSGGFDELRKKMEKFGLAMTTDMVKAFTRANDAMTDLQSAAAGMAVQFASEFAPALADVADALVEGITGDGVEGFKTLGFYAGGVLKSIMLLVTIVASGVAIIIQRTGTLFSATFQLANDVLHGRFRGAWGRFRNQVVTEAAALDAEIEKRMTRVLIALDGINRKPKAKPKGDTSVSENIADKESAEKAAEKARKAALELAEAEVDALARVTAAGYKQQEAAAKEEYERNLVSLQEYFAKRIKLAEQQGKEEADALYGALKILQESPLGKDELQAERQQKIVKAAADWQVKVLENAAAVKQLQADQANETEALQQKALEFERKIQQAQGDRWAAARAEIDAQAAELDTLLQKQGIAAEERGQRVEGFREAGYQQIDFEKLQARAARAMEDLERRRAEIDRQVERGQLYAFEGEERIAALELERLPLLQQIAAAMQAAAVSEEQQQDAAAFQERIEELAASADRAARRIAEFNENVEASLESDLSGWLSSSVDQAENLGDAFRSMAASVVASLRQITSQMLATLAIQRLLGFIGGIGGGAASGSGGGGGGPITVATGGLIRGPGTGVSDSIPARLSNWEYVVRSSVVRQPGMLDHLDMLNYGATRVRRRATMRFADGGLVNAPSVSGGNASLSATLGLDEGLLLKRLEASPEFHRVFIRTAQQNQKAMRQAIGG